jgi:hypothetical protein
MVSQAILAKPDREVLSWLRNLLSRLVSLPRNDVHLLVNERICEYINDPNGYFTIDKKPEDTQKYCELAFFGVQESTEQQYVVQGEGSLETLRLASLFLCHLESNKSLDVRIRAVHEHYEYP